MHAAEKNEVGLEAREVLEASHLMVCGHIDSVLNSTESMRKSTGEAAPEFPVERVILRAPPERKSS